MNFITGRVSTMNEDMSAERSRNCRTSRSTLRRIQRSQSTSSGIRTSASNDSFQDKVNNMATAHTRPMTLETAENRESTAKRWISATSPSRRDIKSPILRCP
ncbi:hypothetical protein D3C85_1032550 [compost metagenome]